MRRIHPISVFIQFFVQLHQTPDLKQAMPLRVSDHVPQKTMQALVRHHDRISAERGDAGEHLR